MVQKKAKKRPGSELAQDRGPGTEITMEEQTPPTQKGTSSSSSSDDSYQQEMGLSSEADLQQRRRALGGTTAVDYADRNRRDQPALVQGTSREERNKQRHA